MQRGTFEKRDILKFSGRYERNARHVVWWGVAKECRVS